MESTVEEPENNTRNTDNKYYDPGSLLRRKASITYWDLCQFAYDAVIKAEETATVGAGSLRRLRASETCTTHDISLAGILKSYAAELVAFD